MLPLYFYFLHHVDPVEVVAQRVLWSLLLVLLILAARRSLPSLRQVVREKRTMLALACSAALIGTNWLTYVWAIQAGHVVGASLGYFLNPLVNVLLGMLVLKERLRRGQLVAIILAAVGVALMATAAIDTLWVSIMLALSFAFYGLVRKLTPVDALAGVGAETLLLAPLALGWCLWLGARGDMAFGDDAATTLLLIVAGAVTTVPLVLFAVAARRMPLAQLGVLQYLAPMMQFLCGILVFGETLNRGQLISFALIWLGLILFAADSFRAARQVRAAAA